jgi:hypothetical protein
LNPDDTDGDGIPNFLDVDDDGDGYGTKMKLRDPILLSIMVLVQRMDTTRIAANDDPLTPNIDERQGIPAYIAASKTLDYTTAGRTRVHLDKNYPVK